MRRGNYDDRVRSQTQPGAQFLQCLTARVRSFGPTPEDMRRVIEREAKDASHLFVKVVRQGG